MLTLPKKTAYYMPYYMVYSYSMANNCWLLILFAQACTLFGKLYGKLFGKLFGKLYGKLFGKLFGKHDFEQTRF